MSYKLTMNRSKIKSAVKSAFRETAIALDKSFTGTIDADIWQWPRQTSPRDIVDTRALLESQTLQFQGDLLALFAWGNNKVKYAPYVYFGVVFGNGTQMPGRPWVEEALKETKPSQVYQTLFRGSL